jgi:hypothetical protein
LRCTSLTISRSGDVSLQAVANDPFCLASLHARVGRLVADDEQVAALAALLVAVDGRVPGHEVHGQLVGFGFLPASAAFEHDPAEVVVHPVVGFELADLQWRAVAGGVADRAEHDVRVGGVAMAQHEAEQLGQLGLQCAGHLAH